jgi:hypothetical protein
MVRPLTLLIFLASGCGADIADVTSDARPVDAMSADDAPRVADGRPSADAQLANCPAGVSAMLGDLGAIPGTGQDESPGEATLNYNINADQLLTVAMYSGYGAFNGGIVPGSYEIKDAEADLTTCALCAAILVYNDGSANLMAEKGTLNITSGSPGALHGSLEQVSFSAIEIVSDGAACTDATDPVCGGGNNASCNNGKCGRQVRLAGCSSQLDSITF